MSHRSTVPQRKPHPLAERALRHAMSFALMGALMYAFITPPPAQAQAPEAVINLYSARHYQTDEALYNNFTRQTGIQIKRIELKDEALLQRLAAEGRNSPADVVLLVDAARLWRAQSDGLFSPVDSARLRQRIPEHLRAPDDAWFGFSTRARVIVYNKASVKPEDVDSYEKLAQPHNKGKVCTRSASHPYMLSLVGSLIERLGQEATENWARAMVANLARPPQGGDTDQIRAVASGECAVALTNSYYWVRLVRSEKPEDQAVVRQVGFLWPNQQSSGTHINISGGAVAKHAPHREAAIRFLEYLASDEAQRHFANGNNEWPAVESVVTDNPALRSLGAFKSENTAISAIGKNQTDAQKLLDRAGYR